MHAKFWLIIGLVGVIALIGGTDAANAQGAPSATLVGRAIMAAESFADGPPSGAAIAAAKTINGVHVPFYNQPVGSITSVIRGVYKGTWLLLSNHGFDTSANSADYLLRLYTVSVDWRTASSGTGAISLLDWLTLTDARNRLKTLTKILAKRELTGFDFDPRAMARAADGSLWIAEAHGPSLLNVSTDGIVQDNVPLTAGSTLQGMSVTPDGKTLLIAERINNSITLETFDTQAKTFTTTGDTYPLDVPTDSTRGWTLINDHQALVIEQDALSNAAAKVKRIYLIDLTSAKGALSKILQVDLLNIGDPQNIGTNSVFNPQPGEYGLKPFTFPFEDVSDVYPMDASTLIVINDNRFPFGKGRIAQTAANTEMIAIKLAVPLTVQLSDNQQ